MEYTVDRIENGYAVLLPRGAGKRIEVMQKKLPAGTAEGDVVRMEHGEFTCDKAAAEEAKIAAKQLFERILKKNGNGGGAW